MQTKTHNVFKQTKHSSQQIQHLFPHTTHKYFKNMSTHNQHIYLTKTQPDTTQSHTNISKNSQPN